MAQSSKKNHSDKMRLSQPIHVVHISSVHHSRDPRIWYKQIGSVYKSGLKVTFITGDLEADGDDGVSVVRVWPGRKNRLIRFLVTSPRAVFHALSTPADIYHFHDPELLPWAWFLLLRSRRVIYDIHEDYETSIRQKPWIPAFLRSSVARIGGYFEKLLSLPFRKIIAEKYYIERFPGALAILNYPRVSDSISLDGHDPDSRQALYTGNVTPDRGAYNMARLVGECPWISLTTIGSCSREVAESMREIVAPGAEDRMHLHGEGYYVDFKNILEAYRSRCWLAGLALFPPTEHYCRKELTKFYEYMLAGLPIVASNFPVWIDLIERRKIGLCVDSTDASKVAEALNWLRENPVKAVEMGRRGRDLAMSEFSWDSQAERLVGFYADLLAVPTD